MTTETKREEVGEFLLTVLLEQGENIGMKPMSDGTWRMVLDVPLTGDQAARVKAAIEEGARDG